MAVSANILPLLEALVQLAITVAPELIRDFNLLKELLISGKDPTPEEQASIDAALEQAHTLLQEHIAAKLNPAPAAGSTLGE